MRLKIVLVSLTLVLFASTQVFAESNWVEEFLMRYRPSIAGAGNASTDSNTATQPQGGIPPQVLRPGEVPITMTDMVTLVLQKNLNVQYDRFTPRSTYLQALAYWSTLMPSLSASFNEGRNTAVNTSQTNGASLPELSTLTHTFTAAYNQIFTPGTNVNVTFSTVRTSTNNQLATFNPSYTSKITYTVAQPLLQGRGKIANLRLMLEGLNTEKSNEAAFEVQVDSLIAQAEKAYWNLVFANQNVDVNTRSVIESKTELEQDLVEYEIGTLAKSDIVQQQASVAARELTLVTANTAQVQAEDQLKQLITDQTDPGMFLIKLTALDLPLLDAQIPSLEDAVKVALENRPELRQVEFAEKNAELDIQYYHNQREPVLTVTGTYTQNGTGGDTCSKGGAVSTCPGIVNQNGLGAALSQLFGYGYNGYSAGVSLVVPLKNRAIDANYGYALVEKKQALANIDVEKQQIALSVRNALTEVAGYRAQVNTAQEALDLARKQVENEKIKLQLGTSQIRFVLEDEITVATDETTLLQAQVNFANALVDLDQAMGLTLKKFNLDLEKSLGATGLTSPTATIHSGTMLNPLNWTRQ